MGYQYLAASSSEVGNGAPSEGADTTSLLEVGMEVCAGWGIMPGMLFLVIQLCTRGVAHISIRCVGFVDVGWYGMGNSLGKRSISFLNALESSSSAVACRPEWACV